MWRSVVIFVRYLSEIRYFESQKPIIQTGFRYCVKLHFRRFRFRFLSGWNCFYSLVRNLNLECAWTQSYHSIKRIINPAFLSQRSGSNLVSSYKKPTYKTCRHQNYAVQQYMDLGNFSCICVIEIGTVSFVKVDRYVYLKFCMVFSTVSLVF